MNSRNFNDWFSSFKSTISSYDYYVDFDKVKDNATQFKHELHLINSLLGSNQIEDEFVELIDKYPNVLNAIPSLLAVRAKEIPIYEVGEIINYGFGKPSEDLGPRDYADFMRQTGLFSMMESKSISNLQDYITGVEVGLDSNARKNRGGHLMENIVESHLTLAGLRMMTSENKKPLQGNPRDNCVFYKEINASRIQEFWNVDLSRITNNGTVEKRFDFVVHAKDCVYGIEVNFYKSEGSKLNETARSYKEIAQESKHISNFKFVWVTDGAGWNSAKSNLQETYEVLDTIYNLADLEDGAFKKLFFC